MCDSASCILCLEGGVLMEPSPCMCRGSLGIHVECLQEIQKSRHTCSVCRTHYRVWMDGSHEVMYGDKRVRFTTVAGRKEGEFLEYDEDGMLLKRCYFRAGVLHGPYVVYHGDGLTPMVEFMYVEGVKEGILREYNEDGVLVGEETYVGGVKEGIVRSFFDDGELMEVYVCVGGRKHGTCLVYGEGGEVLYRLHYRNGELVKDEGWGGEGEEMICD